MAAPGTVLSACNTPKGYRLWPCVGFLTLRVRSEVTRAQRYSATGYHRHGRLGESKSSLLAVIGTGGGAIPGEIRARPRAARIGMRGKRFVRRLAPGPQPRETRRVPDWREIFE